MDTVDQEARLKAWKALVIITIILVLMLNITLLVKIIRAAGGLSAVVTGPRGPRFQTLVSLAIGDIFLALFSLVVRAILVFEDGMSSMPCRTYMLSHFYFQYIMPFVFGVGLVILAVECIIFRRRVLAAVSPATQSPGVMVSLAVSTVPWILGVTIALPMTIAGADLVNCEFDFSLQRVRAIVWVCQILPIAVAVLATCVNSCSTQNSTTSPSSVGNQQTPTMASTSGQASFPVTSAIASLQPTAPPSDLPPPYEELEGAFAKPHPGLSGCPPTEASVQAQPNVFPQSQQHDIANYVLAPNYQTGMPPIGGQHQRDMNFVYGQPPHRQPPYNHPFHGQPSQNMLPPSQASYLPPGSVTYTQSGQPSLLPPPPSLSMYYSVKERTALFIVTSVFFVCVLPAAIFQLAYELNEDRDDLKVLPLTIISDLLYWMLAIRSFLVPFFWVVTGSFKMSHST